MKLLAAFQKVREFSALKENRPVHSTPGSPVGLQIVSIITLTLLADFGVDVGGGESENERRGTICIPGLPLFCPSPCVSNRNFNQQHLALSL